MTDDLARYQAAEQDQAYLEELKNLFEEKIGHKLPHLQIVEDEDEHTTDEEVQRLRDEITRLKSERDFFALEALKAVSAAGICTPEEGYVKYPAAFPGDLKLLIAMIDLGKEHAADRLLFQQGLTSREVIEADGYPIPPFTPEQEAQLAPLFIEERITDNLLPGDLRLMVTAIDIRAHEVEYAIYGWGTDTPSIPLQHGTIFNRPEAGELANRFQDFQRKLVADLANALGIPASELTKPISTPVPEQYEYAAIGHLVSNIYKKTGFLLLRKDSHFDVDSDIFTASGYPLMDSVSAFTLEDVLTNLQEQIDHA